jgi:hypothetical protein
MESNGKSVSRTGATLQYALPSDLNVPGVNDHIVIIQGLLSLANLEQIVSIHFSNYSIKEPNSFQRYHLMSLAI